MAENEVQKQTTFDGGVVSAQIEQWKQRYRRVVRIDVVDGEELHIGYFRRPTMETMKAVTALAKKDELESVQVLAKNCWLGGSESLLTDAVLFVALGKELGTLMGSCMSSLKNV